MIIFAFITVIILVVADQLIKLWCVNNLTLHESVDFIKIGDTKIFDLTLHENTGAMFGSMAGMRFFLIAVTSVIILICIYAVLKYGKSSKLLLTALILFISGGIGNLIDRIFNNGKVIDMFDFQLFDFAIFNFADICVTIGAVIFIIYACISERKEKTNGV